MIKSSCIFGFLVISCASCSSGDVAVSSDNESSSQTGFSQFGVFALRRNSGSTFDAQSTFEGAFASFIEIDNRVSFDEILAHYRLPLDTCVTFRQPNDFIGSTGLIQSYNQLGSGIPINLSAGEVLTLSSLDGSWLDVYRGQGPNYEYVNTNPIIEPVPSTLQLDIPGDSFPGYIDISIPDVETVTLTEPAEGTILQLDTTFIWVPSAQDNAYLRITAEKLVGSERVHLDCAVTDDGEFQIPGSVQSELSEIFQDYAVRVNRTVYSTETSGDSILFIFHLVGSE